jgi:tetratricopeptide (TPR) repeat protein
MKKIVIVFMAALPLFATAQSAKIVNAKNYLSEYVASKDVEALNKAKENIDLAAAHPDTKDKAKTQTLKGQVYLAVFDNDLRLETEKLASIPDPNKRNLVAYQNVNTAVLADAHAALVLAKTLDTKGDYTSEIGNYIANITNRYENKAIADFNAKKYAEALPSFEKAYEINGSKDTTNLNNCALAASRAGLYDKAKLYYEKMAELKVGRAGAYLQLMDAYMNLKDTTGAVNAIKKGRAAYPNDISLLRSEIDIYIQTNKINEALDNLNKAIVAQPTDQVLYYARATMYDHLANPKDSKGKDLEKPKDADEKNKLAEADYKKAIELKPDYFDPLFNLGILYYNNGVIIVNKANSIADPQKYDAAIKTANDEFAKAVTYLEKALGIDPADRTVMTALKNIYYRLEMKEKGDAMKEKLKN